MDQQTTTTDDRSIAHRVDMNHYGQREHHDGLVPWRPAEAPDLASGDSRRTTGRLRSCGYCGSMHPTDLAAALNAGAKAHWADFKYGWPHKLYIDGIPNPHAGMLESRMGASHATPICPRSGKECEHGAQSFTWATCECMKAGEPVQGVRDGKPMVRMQDGFRRDNGQPDYTWRDTGEPAAATTGGKFYTVHLQDATPEEREVIERAMGLRFTFHEDGRRVTWERFASAPAQQGA